MIPRPPGPGPEHGIPPGEVGPSAGGLAHFEERSAQLERDQIRRDNAAKMRALKAKLSSGELDEVDPVRRLWHGLAEGEHHGDRELRQLDSQLKRYMAEDESDPRAVLAWLEDHRTYNGGPA